MKEYTIILEIPDMEEGAMYWSTPKGYWESFQDTYSPIKVHCDKEDLGEELLLYLNNLHKYEDCWILRVEYNTDTSIPHSNKSEDIVRSACITKEDAEITE